MSLNIMIAGCAREEKDGISSSVKEAFSDRAREEAWSVSLVKIANQWSIEINGPEPPYKGLSLVAPDEDLTGALRRAIKNAATAPPAEAAPPSNGNGVSSGEKKDRYSCEGCSGTFEVIFVAAPGEREDMCPVACPQCWHVNHVPIAEGAGATGDYRAQAVTA